MRISFKQRSLGKKVLLSVLAAGVMSGFVLHSEVLAAENQVFNEPVKMEKIELYDANMELNAGGTVSGKTEEHADVAARVGKNSTLKATGVSFTGEITVQDGGQVTLNGGTITAVPYVGEESYAEHTFLRAFSGASITVDNAHVR